MTFKTFNALIIAACLTGLGVNGYGQDAANTKQPARIKVLPNITAGVIAEGSIIFNYVDAKRRRRLSLDVYRPENAEALSPAIVMYFGGGWQNGRPGQFAPTYREASPITHAGPHTPPMLFIDGEFDNPGTRSQELRAILDQHGVAQEFIMLQKAPHPFWVYQKWFAPTVDAVDGFLKKHMK